MTRAPKEITPPERPSLAEANIQVVRVGGGRVHPFGDLFHSLMKAKWPATLLFIFLAYLFLNTIFALVYLALGNSIEHARHGSFEDAFFFSMQTMATIGYGVMTPKGTLCNVIVTLEAITGICAAALTTGLVYAKFARPTARLAFSRPVLIGTVDGKRVLMFRIANERSNRIMEASVHVALARNEITKEGVALRRLYDLKLQRDKSAMFVLTWIVFHTIDESSPLWGHTAESIRKEQISLIASLVGMDETLAQTVHARYSYDWESFVFGARFVDVAKVTPTGRVLDLTGFHSYIEEEDALK